MADAEEAAALLAALDAADAVPYALAFYAGLRRAEIKRLDWPDDGITTLDAISSARFAAGRKLQVGKSRCEGPRISGFLASRSA